MKKGHDDPRAAGDIRRFDDADDIGGTRHFGTTGLPSYRAFATQLVERGVMDDVDAFAYPRSMSMSMSMSMSHLDRVREGLQLESTAEYVEHVRSDASWIDYAYMVEFIQQSDLVRDLDSRLDPEVFHRWPSDFKAEDVDKEIEELLWKQSHPERYERLPDILLEANDYTPRFLHVCGIDPHVHARTVRLIETLSLIAYCVVMPIKNRFKRLRPSQASRLIEPAIPVPAHYSYPSGHATQAHLIATALNELFSEVGLGSLRDHLDHAAEEIARNREWAGVHYSSDSDAGKALAKAIWSDAKTPALTPDSSNNKPLDELYLQAHGEWERHNSPPKIEGSMQTGL